MGGYSVGFMVLSDGIATAFICLVCFRLGDFFGLCRKSTALSARLDIAQSGEVLGEKLSMMYIRR